MKDKFLKQQIVFSAVCMVSGLLLSGCAGPSTRVLPRENHGEYFDVLEESSLLEEANPFYIQETLGILTASHRLSGSRGETEAARMLERYLKDYGYESSRQRFRLWDGNQSNEVTGTNVVAVKKANTKDPEQADILIIGTHHDTADESPGANNNASGVAVWLEMARLVSRMPTDTELRFVSFSGFQDGWLGSRSYVESLSKEERNRVVGAVHLDTLGAVEFPELVLGTGDGHATVLGDLIKQSFWNVSGEILQYGTRDMGDHMSFRSGQIPAMILTQKRSSYEQDTPLDVEETVDVERITRITDCMTNMVAEMMSVETPSVLARSRSMNPMSDSAYQHKKGRPFRFGEARRTLESRMHQEGLLISSTEGQNGAYLEGYQYQMKWFDVDQIILTNYYYSNDMLESISLDADGAGVDMEDMMERLHSWYGEPDQEGSGPNGITYVWQEPLLNSSVYLIENGDGYDVEIQEYHSEKEILGRYRADGTAVSGGESKDSRIPVFFEKWKKLCPDRMESMIEQITFYTDGIGETKGYTEWEEQEEYFKPAVLFIDLEDMLNEQRMWRDETAAEKQILRLLGRVLEEEGAGGAAEAFYTQFPLEEMSEIQTDLRPGEEVQTERFPGFSESFLYFVLTGKYDSRPGEWSERIGFFYQWEELVSMRQEIRSALKLHEDSEW